MGEDVESEVGSDVAVSLIGESIDVDRVDNI